MPENLIQKIKIQNIEYELGTTVENVDGLQTVLDTKQPKGDYLTKIPEGYATEEFVINKIAEAELGGEEVDLSGYAQKSELPTKVSQLQNDSGFITDYTETDPTVPDWAKAPTKPSYTASEVGALPDTTVIPTVPTNVSEFTNDAGYLTEHQSLDGFATEDYVDEKIAAIPTPDVSGQIGVHNVATDSHNDIRLLIDGLTKRLNTLADSDDTTLDQMSEIVAYIKSNKSLIEDVTTNKVNVSDVINDLTTNVSNKPLSAAQGVALKALIDAIVIPTKVSELTNDSGYLSFIPTEYITETELNAKGYLTEHQSLAEYAKISDIPTKPSDIDAQPYGDYALRSEIPTDYLTEIPDEYVTETELNAKGYLTSYIESDPTVPDWAKAATKPSYTKSEVGLENVDNVRQYSSNNPPPYPVRSVNGKTGSVTLNTVPNCSALNNGQFLRVVNGVAAWSTVPRAEEEVF